MLTRHPPPDFLVQESGCPAVHPLSRASRGKRYNILDFLRKSCVKGGTSPFGFPLHFLGPRQYKPQKRLVLTGLENGNSSTVLHPQTRRAVIRRGHTPPHLPGGNSKSHTVYSVYVLTPAYWPGDAGQSHDSCRV